MGVPHPLAQPQNPKPLGSEGPIYLGAYSNPIDFALQKIGFEEGKAMEGNVILSPTQCKSNFMNWKVCKLVKEKWAWGYE